MVHEFGGVAVGLGWILNCFVGYGLWEVGKYQCFCRFELEGVSIYEVLPALDLAQSVHAGVSIGVRRVVRFGISGVPLVGLGTRLGWGADGGFLRNLHLNEFTLVHVYTLIVYLRG